MRIFFLSFVFFSLLFSHYAQAQQTDVVPTAATATVGGSTFLGGPLGTGARTFQWLINENQLTSVVGREITAITFRLPTAAAASAWPASAMTYNDYDIYLSESVTPASRSLTFANNIVGAQTQVRNGSLNISADAFPGGAAGLKDFGSPITFNTPYLYTGGHLLVEVRHTGATGTNISPDAVAATSGSLPGYGTDFSSCQQTNYTATAGLQSNFVIVQLISQDTGPCTTPPTAGNAVSTVTNVCSGTNFGLTLSGNSTGAGQTYQWQSSTTGNAPWTDVGTLGVTPSVAFNQTATTWYRCAVACSGQTAYSDSIEITTPSLVNGTYTINPFLPTGSGNFENFEDALDHIKCGINGPIVFNVEPGTYPINQIVIPAIYGTSATNTITFNGNGTTLTYNASTSALRTAVVLNGADHIIIDSFNIDASAGTYGWGIVLTNKADSNIIRNCTINIGNLTSASTNYLGIAINGSATGTAISGDNGNGNLIEGNTIIGGYYGIYLYGSSTLATANNDNKLIGNNIQDIYSYSLYAIYQSSGLVLSKNDISRPARSTLTTHYGIYLTTGCVGALVEKNRLHNMYDGAPTNTSSIYVIYVATDGTSANPTRVENNAIYSIGGDGTIYGIYNTEGAYMLAYHNTISLDNTSATAGTTYGFYQTTTDNGIEFKNNIVNITRGGSGVKYCIYKSTATTPIVSDNNVFYLGSLGSGAQHIGYQTGARTTLSDWQTASSQDANSISTDPIFTDPIMGDYSFNELSIDNIGVPLGVLTDINEINRSLTTPDPGAFELPPSTGIDMRPETLLLPELAAEGCYTTETITVRVKNNSVNLIDFSTTPLTVTVNVTGAATATYSAVVNTGTLASDATQDVTMVSPSATLNMSTPGGYNFEIITSVTGDVNTANDILNIQRDKVALTAGIAEVSNDILCASGTPPTLTAIDVEGYSSVKWQQSTTSSTGFTDIPGADTIKYTLSTTPPTNMYYRLIAVCGSNESISTEIMVVVNNPQILTTTPATRCGTGTVDLSATGTGIDISWYADATGGQPLGTGNNFTTPVINATTTFYAAASDGGGLTNVGKAAPVANPTSGAGQGNYGLVFNALSTFMLHSVDIYPINTTAGTPGTVDINVVDATGAIVHSTTVNVIGNPVSALVPQTVILDFLIQPGTNYRMVPANRTGISGLAFDPAAQAPGGSYDYPFELPGIVSIHTSTYTAYPGMTAMNDLYYYFYNWQIATGCEGTRVPVIATVTPPASLTSAGGDKVLCFNAIDSLEAIANTGDFNSFEWSPVTDLYSDAAATIPYTGGNITKVYVRSTTPGKIGYTCTATNTTTLCANAFTDSVTVMPDPVVTVSPNEICVSGAVTLTATPTTGYGVNSLQWQESSDGITFANISGANTAVYTTSSITSTTHYQLVLKDGSSNVCPQTSSSFVVTVNSPQIISTTPNYNCGAGTVDLSAMGTGSDINWYENATGGTSIATGNNFTTPVISTTTTYYVAASDGGGNFSAGQTTPFATSTGFTGNNYGMVFDATQDFTLVSVDVYSTAATGTLTINLVNSGGSIIASSGALTVPAGTGTTFGGGATPTTFTLNFDVPVGTGYRLVTASHTGGPIVRDNPIGSNFSYPLPIGSVGNITSGWLSGSANTNTYYYFYNWQISTGCESNRVAVTATIDNSPTCGLPVTYSSFTGRKEGNTNLLEWITATESNNLGFELQRSADGRSYSKLDFISSKADNGNSNIALSYTYNDDKPLASNNYYRLKQMDKDGRVNYSNVVLLKGEKATQVSITGVYPNPTKHTLNVNIASPSTERVSIVVTDISGKVLIQQQVVLNSGDNIHNLDVSRLSQGTYLIKTICNNGCESAVIKFAKY